MFDRTRYKTLVPVHIKAQQVLQFGNIPSLTIQKKCIILNYNKVGKIKYWIHFTQYTILHRDKTICT